MPAEKTLRSQKKRAINNKITRTYTRSRLKIASESIESEANVKSAISALDRAVSKGIIHKNNASRKKSRLLNLDLLSNSWRFRFPLTKTTAETPS